jgi:hypothetical protein
MAQNFTFQLSSFRGSGQEFLALWVWSLSTSAICLGLRFALRLPAAGNLSNLDSHVVPGAR